MIGPPSDQPNERELREGRFPPVACLCGTPIADLAPVDRFVLESDPGGQLYCRECCPRTVRFL